MLQMFSEYLDILCILQTYHVEMVTTSASIIVISWNIVIVLVINHLDSPHHRQTTNDHLLDHHCTRASHLSDESILATLTTSDELS